MESLLSISELQSLTSHFSSQSGRQSESAGEQIEQILNTLEFQLSCDETEQRQHFIDACMRCLRNSVAGVARNQVKVGERILLENNSLTDYVEARIVCVQSVHGEDELLSLRLSLQLLANLLVGQLEIQKHFLGKSLSLIQDVLTLVKDEKTANIAAMIVNIFLSNEETLSDSDDKFHSSLSSFISPLSGWYSTAEDCTLVGQCLEKFFMSDHYLRSLSSEERAQLSPILPFPPEENIVRLLATDFTYLTDLHLLITGMTSKVSTALEAHHVLSLTELLTKCSGLEGIRETLQSNRSLLINTLSLLKLVHQSAKADGKLTVLNKLR